MFVAGLWTGLVTGTGAAAGIAGAFAAGTKVGAAIVAGGTLGKLLTSVALTALQTALQRKSQSGGGLTISTTLRGETNPETIILGRYATAGQAICPPYSHGKNNAFMTHVVELCSMPGAEFLRLFLNGNPVTLGATAHPDYGFPVTDAKYIYKGQPLIWVRYYDGSQTAADPMLLAKYGSHPDRPWTPDMIGHGLCYAILTFLFSAKAGLTQVPRYRFEMLGPPLYDLRKDSTAGGVGAHRLNQPASWQRTQNPLVAAWNIFHGIVLPGGDIWGGQVEVADLPPAAWMAAMNVCDQPVPLEAGGTEPRFRFGLEVPLTHEPSAALVEILKAADAQVADCGGSWTVRAGGPGLPVRAFSDDDVLRSRPEELDPFPGLAQTWNAVAAQYPDPEAAWETRDAPLRTNAEWEAADRFGRRTADLSLPAVPYGLQAQRLGRAWIEDERRFARHIVNLPEDCSDLDPLDTATWQSPRNGYAAGKVFDIAEVAEDVRSCKVQLSIRETDPSDRAWFPAYELPQVPVNTASTPLPPSPVSGFTVEPYILTDSSNQPRRHGWLMRWDDDLIANGLRWRARLSGTTDIILLGSVLDVSAGMQPVVEGTIPGGLYEVAAALIANQDDHWTGWHSVLVPDIRLTSEDLGTTGLSAPTGLSVGFDMLDGWVDVTLSWSPVAGAAQYIVGVGALTDVVAGTALRFRSLPATPYDLWVRAVDGFGNQSDPSDILSIVTPADSVPPEQVTGVTGMGGFGMVSLGWIASLASDLSIYEVYQSTSDVDPDAATAPTYLSASTTAIVSPLADDVTYHFWVRAVDTSGNKGEWSDRVTVKTVTASSRVQQEIDDATWATKVPANKIILDGTVQTPHLAARVVTASKMLITSENLIENHDFGTGDFAGWTLANSASAISLVPITSGDWAPHVPYVCRFDGNGTTISMWGVEGGLTAGNANEGGIPVTPGDKFLVSIMSSNPSSVAGAVLMGCKNVQTGALSYPNFGLIMPAGNPNILTTTAEFTVPAGVTRINPYIYWQNSQVGSGINWSKLRLIRKADGALIVDGAIYAHHLTTGEVITDSAQIRDAIINSAHIQSLSAAKLLAGTALATTLTVSGTALSVINSNAALGAQNPATRINSASTQIDPGKILVSGSTTLAHWRGTADQTKIDGGSIEANSILTSSLTVRGAGGVLNTDPFFEGAADWAPGLWRTTAPAGDPGPWFLYQTSPVNLIFPKTQVPINSTKNYRLSVWFRNQSGNSRRSFLAVQFLTVAGVVITGSTNGWSSTNAPSGNHYWPSSSTVPPTTMTEYTLNFGPSYASKIPANAAFIRFGVYLNYLGSGTGRGDWGGLVVREMAAGVDIVDGAITAAKVTTSGLITSSAQINSGIINNAHIAGAIQSTDFIPGFSGWQINKNGTAQFNSLIVRNSLVVGSVSDIVQKNYPSTYQRNSVAWQMVDSILLGSMETTDIWTAHASAGVRALSGTIAGSPSTAASQFRLLRRVQVDGVWGSYTVIGAGASGLSATTWMPITINETIAGDYTNVEYRMDTLIGDVVTGPTNHNYRRMALVARKVTR